MIALIGNGTPYVNHSRTIDEADLVVRINTCDHIGTGKVGSKTDILFIRSTANPYGRYVLDWLPMKAAKCAKQVVIIPAFPITDEDPTRKEYLEKYPPVEFVNMDPELMRLGRNLLALGFDEAPTAGFLALLWLQGKFSLYGEDLCLFGFLWRFDGPHNVEKEKEFILRQESQGLIRLAETGPMVL